VSLLKAGILGASGYGGSELLRRLGKHEGVVLSGFASRQFLGKPLREAWPQLSGSHHGEMLFQSDTEVIEVADVVFFATPHGATAPLVAQARAAGKLAVDLSADYRLEQDPYRHWYGQAHPHPELLAEARYGLPELHRHELKDAQLIASPGCNATAATLALAPLAATGQLGEATSVTIATGISGAGRSPKQPLHFPEAMDSVVPYSTGGTHRHIGEVEANLGRVAAQTDAADLSSARQLRTHGEQKQPRLTFTPMRVPMVRGILAVATTRPASGEADSASLLELYRQFYEGDRLIHVQDTAPETKSVSGTDRAIVSVEADPRTGMIIAYCALDNLGKGAAGQAVQAFNIAAGFPETTALELEGRWP